MNRRRLISRLLATGMVCAIALLGGSLTLAILHSLTAPAMAQAEAMFPALTVYRSPTCNCCGRWVDHMEAAGFQVQEVVTEDMAAIKDQYGVPESMASCHTAIAGDYLVEGHVPAADVQRLLSQHPNVLGIAAPGMPTGSPGMESGDRADPYTVFSFTKAGQTSPFAEH